MSRTCSNAWLLSIMRVFEGLTGDEIAERLHCSPRTVANYWDFARHWLRKEYGPSCLRNERCWTNGQLDD